MSRLWLLGAPDPEMERIERLLREAGERFEYVRDATGARVRPDNAYRASAPDIPSGVNTVFLVESEVDGLREGDSPPWKVVCIDHHRPGDPGYGKPPVEFLSGSSLGQVLSVLWGPIRQDKGGWVAGDRLIPEDLILAAASDHCPAAAYQGRCPGVDPSRLMEWRIEVRARFQGRSPDAIRRDVMNAVEAVSTAPWVELAEGVRVRDLRGKVVPELPEALLWTGQAAVARVRLRIPTTASPNDRDGRWKIVLLGAGEGTSVGKAPVEAFLGGWAQKQGLQDLYGDPARGFAGGFEP